jgi:phage recombination protein Bet
MNAATDHNENGRALAVVESPAPFARGEISLERLKAVQDVIAPGCTPAELKVFAEACRRTGLDPFQRQIYAIKRSGRLTIQTGIDGYRVLAERSGRYAGQVGPYWCGADGQWHDVWLAKEAPAAARVGVLRRDFDKPIWAVARTEAYRVNSNSLWGTMPDVMVAKCAEALALRRAFPTEISGVYTEEEMQQAERAAQDTAPISVVSSVVEAEPATVNEGEHERVPTAAELKERLLATGDPNKLQLQWARWWNETGGEVGRLLARVEKREADYRGWVKRLRDRAYDAGIVRDEEGWADLVVSIVERNDVSQRPPSYAEWKAIEVEVETVAEQIAAERRTETPDGDEVLPDEHRLDELEPAGGRLQ